MAAVGAEVLAGATEMPAEKLATLIYEEMHERRPPDEAARATLIEAFRQAVVDLIEFDAVPFAEFETNVLVRGKKVPVALTIKARSK